MKPNWEYVKKVTLWHYEELLKKLEAVLTYPTICQAYNHSMPHAIEYAQHLFLDRNIAAGEFPADMMAAFGRLQSAGVKDWADLLNKVSTREDCEAFLSQKSLGFEEVINVQNYLLRWAFPFYTTTRELLEHDNPQEMEFYATLKQNKLMCSFDLLEQGRSARERRRLAEQTGLPYEFITTLVHRADIARLPYVRRKTILPLCGAGYDTLAKLAAVDLNSEQSITQMEAELEAYFQRTQGKPWDDFKSVILLRGVVNGARALPKLLID